MARTPPPMKKGKAGNNDRNNDRNNGGKGKGAPFGGKRAMPFGNKPPRRNER